MRYSLTRHTFSSKHQQDKLVPHIVNSAVKGCSFTNLRNRSDKKKKTYFLWKTSCSNQIINNPIHRLHQRSVRSFVLSRCITGVTRSPPCADVTSVALLKSLQRYILDARRRKHREARRLIRLAQRVSRLSGPMERLRFQGLRFLLLLHETLPLFSFFFFFQPQMFTV